MLMAPYAIALVTFPRIMDSTTSPDGRHRAEVVVRPDGIAWSNPLSLTATVAGFGTCNIDARVVDRSTGHVVLEQRLTPSEDCEDDARGAKGVWSGCTARFVSRRDEVVLLTVPDGR